LPLLKYQPSYNIKTKTEFFSNKLYRSKLNADALTEQLNHCWQTGSFDFSVGASTELASSLKPSPPIDNLTYRLVSFHVMVYKMDVF